MASERLRSAQDLLDLTFQSLAMQHMDLKQLELDTAVAKVDELSKQLESLWIDGPGPPKEGSSPNRSRSSWASDPPEFFGAGGGSGGGLGDTLTPPPNSPRPSPLNFYPGGEDRAPSPRPKILAVPYEASNQGGGRAPSPRPLPRAYGEFLGYGGGSPRSGEGGVFFPPLPPPPYEVQGLYPSISSAAFRVQDDLGLKRRPQKSWNESDLDVAYEKKPPGGGGYERSSEGQPGARPWRESSLDGGSKEGPYGGLSSTLPRNYKVPPPMSGGGAERWGEGPFGRPAPSTLPRSWHPVSRIAVPPPAAGRPPRSKPLPLSMIFRLQNAAWEGQGGWGGARGGLLLPRVPQKQLQGVPPPAPPAVPGGEGSPRPLAADSAPPDPEAELLDEGLLQIGGAVGGPDPEVVERPLSPTRLQPLLPPGAQGVPEFEEVARVLAEMPRPLKRRGSMELNPGGGPGGAAAAAPPPAPGTPPNAQPPPADPPTDPAAAEVTRRQRGRTGAALGAAGPLVPPQTPPRDAGPAQPPRAAAGRGAHRGAGRGAARGGRAGGPQPAQRRGHHRAAQRHLRRPPRRRRLPAGQRRRRQLARQPRLDPPALRGLVQRHGRVRGAGATRRRHLRHHRQRRQHGGRQVRPLPRGLRRLLRIPHWRGAGAGGAEQRAGVRALGLPGGAAGRAVVPGGAAAHRAAPGPPRAPGPAPRPGPGRHTGPGPVVVGGAQRPARPSASGLPRALPQGAAAAQEGLRGAEDLGGPRIWGGPELALPPPWPPPPPAAVS